MLLDGRNPYAGTLPATLTLTREDFACALSETNAAALRRRAEWTVVAYVGADVADLAPHLFADLLEMKSAAASDDLNVCTFFEGPLLNDTFFARLNAHANLADDIILRWGKRHANEPATLSAALQLGRCFPARKTAAFLSGHGAGWQGILGDDNVGKAFLSGAGVTLPAPSDVCYRHLHVDQIAAQAAINGALGDAGLPAGKRYDVLALDACNMGAYELLATLSEHADIFVVSQNAMPPGGYPYDAVLGRLRDQPGIAPADFAGYLVSETKRFYAAAEPARFITQIAIARAGLLAFGDAFAQLCAALGALDGEAEFDAVKQALERTLKDAKIGTIDLKVFLTEIAAEHPRDAVRALGTAALERWSAMIVAQTPGRTFDTNGIAIYAPTAAAFDKTYLDVTRNAGLELWQWTRFLARYYAKGGGMDALSTSIMEQVAATPAGSDFTLFAGIERIVG